MCNILPYAPLYVTVSAPVPSQEYTVYQAFASKLLTFREMSKPSLMGCHNATMNPSDRCLKEAVMQFWSTTAISLLLTWVVLVWPGRCWKNWCPGCSEQRQARKGMQETEKRSGRHWRAFLQNTCRGWRRTRPAAIFWRCVPHISACLQIL